MFPKISLSLVAKHKTAGEPLQQTVLSVLFCLTFNASRIIDNNNYTIAVT